jgi:hypothetical protein
MKERPMSFAEYTVFGGGDPLDVLERRRRSPLGLSGPVGEMPDDPTEKDDAIKLPEKSTHALDADQPSARPTTGANNQEDLARVRRALQEAAAPDREEVDGAPDVVHASGPRTRPTGAPSIARALRRFQAAAGLKIDGFAAPGGPTDRTLDNHRRRVWRLAAENRRPEDETIDDRLAAFLDDRARRRRIETDDLAALQARRTGRLHLIRLAGATDAAGARPILERHLAHLRAERAKGPPDDGSRPPPDDNGDDEPPPKPNDDPPPPNSDECRRLWEALRRAKQAVADAEQRMADLWDEFHALGSERKAVKEQIERIALENALSIVFRRVPITRAGNIPAHVRQVLEHIESVISPTKRMVDDIVGLTRLIERFQDLQVQAKTLHDDVIMPLQNEELPALRDAVREADIARVEAGCLTDPEQSDQSR